ncbi:hypothetical protein [Aphanothece sacrum]|uniref:Uncharacterized protein n=1 Tax=Aphanothece sacrum FPU1 TaxID=1920663 RepID=A0A401ID68_APHSA|nr:hypothetical protein [Aphanothece sacrum]GBF79192.1 hypothetical protein AsFPU1_0584 [Aphanothece sacrum FPU1]GBF86582.1 hypothetical protein AsFPU3_3653 [Aphanothece sacrum FPU3]
MTEQVLNLQQDIWIDQHWLQQAGLGQHLQIIVQQGEISIISALDQQKQSDSSETVWTSEAIEVFRSLGQEATSGQLGNTSINHDQYLLKT